MRKFLVSGLVNVETTLPVQSFPIEYVPLSFHFGEIQTAVSGVGYNIATALTDPDDPYNRNFMAAAHILFMSHERLPLPPQQWAQQVQARYDTPIIVIGMGAVGALLAVKADSFMEVIPAATTRPVVNTVGAGDALFSAFNYFYQQSHDPYAALKLAMLFASYKIGESGGSKEFLTETAVRRLV